MVLEVGGLIVVTEYFIIATGATDRQVRTIAEEVEKVLKQNGLPAIGREGEREGKWLLLDFGDVVVHVFQPDEREFYRLERLWGEAPRLPLPADIVNASPAAIDRERARTKETVPSAAAEGSGDDAV